MNRREYLIGYARREFIELGTLSTSTVMKLGQEGLDAAAIEQGFIDECLTDEDFI